MSSSTAATAAPTGLTLGILDLSIIAILLGTSAVIGVYLSFLSKGKNPTDEYRRGCRQMKVLPIAISLITSQLSGMAIMSVPGEVYTYGICYIFHILAMIAAIPILIYAIVPVYCENKITNCYEYLEMRFSKATRQVVTGTFVGGTLLLLPVYMFLPSLAFSQVAGIKVMDITTMLCCLSVVCTLLGGIKTVLWTDVAQSGVILLLIVFVSVLSILRTGGISTVIENASEGGRLNFDFRLDPRIRITFWNTLGSGLIMWIGSIGMNQSSVQRIVSLPSLSHAKKALVLTGIGFLIAALPYLLSGIIISAQFFGCDPMQAGVVSKADKIMPFFIQNIAGHITGLPGVFLSCVFSAALSNLSGHLNSLAGVVYFDYIIPHIRHTEGGANTIMRLLVIAMGIYCFLGGFVVQKFDSILQALATIGGITMGANMGVFLMGMLVPRVGSKAALTGVLFSITVMASIIIKAQMSIEAGHIKYVPLPTSIDQCEARNFPRILNAINTTTTVSPFTEKPPLVTDAFSSNREFSIFEISFQWYRFLGALLVFVWAIPMSYVWTSDRRGKQSSKLFSPFVRRFLSESNTEEPEGLPLKGPLQKNTTELEINKISK
ncbi:sodium-coupled monocarboxylate transporter 2-like [Scaptodrosophila lebanonensis]|uniref:Sodium-coupled monocarboxylate transporter 2-like n=1 Tax=Drosophila lebanonensis TaxID=7225 RepID=A0A6J2TXE3_DROLE|nr:sodium-coupled monocarboxylate transporter 2-like [Scaptodrosophila lebanonensis]